MKSHPAGRDAGKCKVLFVCVGNSCRSQMAEGYTRAYGADVISAESAGLYPAMSISGLTREVMREKNIDLSSHFPKSLDEVDILASDIIVNMSGQELPAKTSARVLHWKIPDPIGAKKEVYLQVSHQIEMAVMRLILELRNSRRTPPSAGRASR